jgi:dCMP deaminase
MKDPDQLWYDLVNRFGDQSRCQSRQVGAILVYENRLFAQGWNSAPYGSVTSDCPRCLNRTNCQSGQNLAAAICVHAEANCLMNAARAGHRTLGATLYCTTYPCAECAKAIVQAGIYEVVYQEKYNSPLTELIFKQANMKVRRFDNVVMGEKKK